jgi:polar amino acid transport system substrate-binding protein
MGRMIAAIWMLIGIIWFAGFTATLSSALTVDRIKHGEIQELSDLENRRVAVIEGTTSEEFIRLYNVKVFLADSFDDLISRLKRNEVEAIIYDAPALMYIAKIDPSIKVVGDLFDEQQYGVVFPEGRNENYKELFNIDIISMKKSGESRKIHDKWF